MQRGADRSIDPHAEALGHSLGPVRTCVGCRSKQGQAELLRFRRRRDGQVVPAIARRDAQGRGAWLCPRPNCFTTAERHRAFGRAFALTHGQAGSKPTPVEVQFDPATAWADAAARLQSEIELLDRCSANLREHPRRRALARLASALAESTPPGRAAESTRKGRASESTPPGRVSESTPPGRASESTHRGRASESTPPGRRELTSQPAPLERSPTSSRKGKGGPPTHG